MSGSLSVLFYWLTRYRTYRTDQLRQEEGFREGGTGNYWAIREIVMPSWIFPILGFLYTSSLGTNSIAVMGGGRAALHFSC
jgi:hypothetical protein